MINALGAIQTTAGALNAERVRMDIVSQNIANADSTRGADGKPYQRHQVVFERVLDAQTSFSDSAPSTIQARVVSDPRPARQVYDPGHPDANEQGIVSLPDINIHEEMADLISASRAFEANLAVVKNARQMALQTLSIGKR